MQVAALSSVPRLAFGAHCKVAQRAFGECGIPLYSQTGPWWEQALQNGLTVLMEQGFDFVITLDYDTIFDAADVRELLRLATDYPAADALVPWQSRRGGKNGRLFSVVDAQGRRRLHADAEEFEVEVTPIATGHFGLTLLRLASLKRMPKPWFWSKPNPDTGEWDEGRIDADIYFWRQFQAVGRKAFLANTVSVGHLEEFVTWIDGDFQSIIQPLSEWQTRGKPETCR